MPGHVVAISAVKVELVQFANVEVIDVGCEIPILHQVLGGSVGDRARLLIESILI